MITQFVDGLLPFFRQQAASQMTDTVAIFAVSKTRLAATSSYTYEYTTIYIGPGKIQFFDNAYEQKAIAGGQEFIIDRSFLHLPHDTPHIEMDQYVQVLESATSPQLMTDDRVWRITNVPVKTRATALRLPILEELSVHG